MNDDVEGGGGLGSSSLLLIEEEKGQGNGRKLFMAASASPKRGRGL